MAVFNEPSKWQTSLVNSGDANTIPQNTPTGTGEASFEDGFPQITQVPIGAGGIAPDRKDFNGLFKILGDWIFFAQNGGLPTYSSDFDYVVGRVVLYNGNLYKCIQANGVSSTVVAPDSDDTYWQQLDGENTSTSLIPNQIITSPVPLTDANLHLLDGALLSGSGAYSAYVAMMAELYTADPTAKCWTTETDWQDSVTQYGVCGQFVYNSVNNTLRLPKISGFIEGTLSTSDIGKVTGAGLPNITGVITTNDPEHAVASGAFAFGAERLNNILDQSGGAGNDATFDASRCSTIYGNATTVQPQSTSVYFYIVLGTVSKTEIQIDIDNVMADLALKANTDLSNVTLTSAFATAMNSANIRTVVETYVSGTSGYRVYSDGFCEQWGLRSPSSNTTISLLKAYLNTDYNIQLSLRNYEYSNSWCAITALTTSSFTLDHQYITAISIFWRTCGYVS